MSRITKRNIHLLPRHRKKKFVIKSWMLAFALFVVTSLVVTRYYQILSPDELYSISGSNDNGTREGSKSIQTGDGDNGIETVHGDNDSALSPEETLTKKMNTRLSSLPSPPWPQVDHRTAEAIARGTILGLDGYSPSIVSNTIVTAYYEFKSKHGVGEYHMWMRRLLRASEPMIIFVEPGSKWFEFVVQERSHAPTIVVPMKFDDLVMSSTFTESFWQYQHSIDLEAKVHKGTGVYKIWNEKMIFLYNAIQLNPFNSPSFAWMDIGYFRNDRDAPKAGEPVIKVNITESGVPAEKVFAMHVRNDPLTAPGRVNIAGNSFFGTGHAFLAAYTQYYQTFWDWIFVKHKFIGSDQFVMTETCRRYHKNCYPYFAGRFKSWFGISALYSGKTKVRGESKDYLFLDQEPVDLPTVPSGKRVSYCNNKVVVGLEFPAACQK